MGTVHRLDVVPAGPQLAGAIEAFLAAVPNANTAPSRCGRWSSSSVGARRWRCWTEEAIDNRIGGHLDQPAIEHVPGGR